MFRGLMGLATRVGALAVCFVLVLLYWSGNAHGSLASSAKFPAFGELDCNGDSAIQAPVNNHLLCLQPAGKNGVFTDNGWYVGHDEPGMGFLSSRPGSANNFEFKTLLPKNNLSAGGHPSFQDYPTFWISVEVCDNNSYPQNPCLPNSDSNLGQGKSPKDAGSGFVELQFYAPGWPNFYQNLSCDMTHWCAAVNIDSVECTFAYAFCNPNCTEPVNFAFLTRDGAPIGPPSPQLATPATFDFPASPDVFLMNPGDIIVVSVHDTAHGMYTGISDLTTGTSGFMIASGANGFMNTDLNTCAGSPYDFHTEFSTATRSHVVPWGSGPYGVVFDVETGHFEFPGHDQRHDADNIFCGTPPGEDRACIGTDIDFDSVPYHASAWPVGTSAGKFRSSPVNLIDLVPHKFGLESNGRGYDTYQFVTDIGSTIASVTNCNPLMIDQCTLPDPQLFPSYAGFYPFFSTQSSTCSVYFGDVQGIGFDTHGGSAEYGPSAPTFVGASITYVANAAYYENSCDPK